MSQTRQSPNRRPPTTKPVTPAVHDSELIDEMSEFLDEVDAVLEDQEHLVSFRQKGGQ